MTKDVASTNQVRWSRPYVHGTTPTPPARRSLTHSLNLVSIHNMPGTLQMQLCQRTRIGGKLHRRNCQSTPSSVSCVRRRSTAPRRPPRRLRPQLPPPPPQPGTAKGPGAHGRARAASLAAGTCVCVQHVRTFVCLLNQRLCARSSGQTMNWTRLSWCFNPVQPCTIDVLNEASVAECVCVCVCVYVSTGNQRSDG